jgi:hypothetical protein
LKPEKKYEAIFGYFNHGPDLGDIVVLDNCNPRPWNNTFCFGTHSTSDAGMDKTVFFTGSQTFKVKEIEYEIIDYVFENQSEATQRARHTAVGQQTGRSTANISNSPDHR